MKKKNMFVTCETTQRHDRATSNRRDDSHNNIIIIVIIVIAIPRASTTNPEIIRVCTV